MHEDDNDSTIVFVTSAIIFYDKIVASDNDKSYHSRNYFFIILKQVHVPKCAMERL